MRKNMGKGWGGRGRQLGEEGIRKEGKQGRIRTGQSEEKGGRVSKYKRKEGEKNGEGRVAREGGGERNREVMERKGKTEGDRGTTDGDGVEEREREGERNG